MGPLLVLQEEKMEKSIESVKTKFNSVRTGRANASLLDRVEVWHLS
jgi:ribosome recycling factor